MNVQRINRVHERYTRKGHVKQWPNEIPFWWQNIYRKYKCMAIPGFVDAPLFKLLFQYSITKPNNQCPCKKKEQNLHATILFQCYAQNVKVNLGHNFQIRRKRGRELRERERERDCIKDKV